MIGDRLLQRPHLAPPTTGSHRGRYDMGPAGGRAARPEGGARKIFGWKRSKNSDRFSDLRDPRPRGCFHAQSDGSCIGKGWGTLGRGRRRKRLAVLFGPRGRIFGALADGGRQPSSWRQASQTGFVVRTARRACAGRARTALHRAHERESGLIRIREHEPMQPFRGALEDSRTGSNFD